MNNKLYEHRWFENKGEAFKYDEIYRLTGVKYEVTNLSPTIAYADYTGNPEETYDLDGVGNRLEVANGTITTTYTANALNQYDVISGTSLFYDDNGNMLGNGVITCTYNYVNQLIKVIRSDGEQVLGEYKYDCFGRRIYKEAWSDDTESFTETNFYYDGARCIEERNSSDTVIATYVFGNGIDEILTMERNSQTYYYHENSLGSIYAVTTGTGNVAERYLYNAYGEVTFLDTNGSSIVSSTIGNRILFSGREFDAETGLYYYRTRYYSADMGRFLQRDPMEDDDLSNLYAYVENDPINSFDPFGTDKNRGQINASNPQKAKKLTEVQPPSVSVLQPPEKKPPVPEPPIIKCDKWGEYSQMLDAFIAVINEMKTDPEKKRCSAWQVKTWDALRVRANKLKRERNEKENGEFEHWEYDAVNMWIPWLHRSVAVWQKGTHWKQGKLFDQWGSVRNVPGFTTIIYRRYWDKTQLPPQPY
jgi:RHS repeat-associated protein